MTRLRGVVWCGQPGTGNLGRVVVIAIGGSASVGKTTAAVHISRRLSLDHVVHVDDLRGRSFIDATPRVWSKPAVWLIDALLAETEQIHGVIASKIDTILAASGSGLIEGEGVEPRLMPRWPAKVVRPVYVIEGDADRLRETFARRSSAARFLSLSEVEQRAVVEMNRRYASWLRDEAEAYGQACVESQPWDTLTERMLAAIGCDG